MANQKTLLVLNVGSSSIKCSIYKDGTLLEKGTIEEIFDKDSRQSAIKSLVAEIEKRNLKIDAIVHRVVHGLDLKQTSIITKQVLSKIQKAAKLAPLHNIPQLDVIYACKKEFKCTQIACFDTAFHSSMDEITSTYAIPFEYSKKGIKKYGFHGLSHSFVSKGLKGKVITCHLGNGCSITAIKNGKSIDTSMGFTPLEGLVMGTRSGTIDPAIIFHLAKTQNLQIEKIEEMLNKKSGLLGISKKTSNMLLLLKNMKKDAKAKLAVEIFLDRVVKQIGAFAAKLNGVDSIVFTAGIGQNNDYIRARICENLSYLGVKLDASKNKSNAKLISSSKSKVKIHVIPTNEEEEMLQSAVNLIK